MAESLPPLPQEKKRAFWLDAACANLILAFFLAVLFIPVSTDRPTSGLVNVAMQNARCIGLVMFQYSCEHDGKYPTGNTSTEVFQKLVDGNYITNPTVFYVSIPGKTPATSKHLKPENVCWDVTSGIATDDSDDLPLVFLTGYKLNYQPGATLQPIKQTRVWMPWELWDAWWNQKSWKRDYVPVCYKGQNTESSKVWANGTIPNFILKSFDSHGKVYKQLTP